MARCVEITGTSIGMEYGLRYTVDGSPMFAFLPDAPTNDGLKIETEMCKSFGINWRKPNRHGRKRTPR